MKKILSICFIYIVGLIGLYVFQKYIENDSVSNIIILIIIFSIIIFLICLIKYLEYKWYDDRCIHYKHIEIEYKIPRKKTSNDEIIKLIGDYNKNNKSEKNK